MRKSMQALLLFLSTYLFPGCNDTQPPVTTTVDRPIPVGGGCDGCELMYVGMPDTILSSDTSEAWMESGQKLLVTGTVYQLDGKTPASDVIIYYWHTDARGFYTPSPNQDSHTKRHGRLRGWVKTDSNGRYDIYTCRPAPYPEEELPAHIHLSVKEPDLPNEYYTDEINFDDDKRLLPFYKKNKQENRGGSGIVRLLVKDSVQIAEHNIVLGLNIPHYPKKLNTSEASGLAIGEDQPSFGPFHAYGPDKGSSACPVCKYGRYHGILYFVGNNPNWEDIKRWLKMLDEASALRYPYLKVYFVYGNAHNYNRQQRDTFLFQLGEELGLRYLALTHVPSLDDRPSDVYQSKINPNVVNTFIVYKHRNIVDKYVNLKPTPNNFNLLLAALDRTQGLYFGLNTLSPH